MPRWSLIICPFVYPAPLKRTQAAHTVFAGLTFPAAHGLLSKGPTDSGFKVGGVGQAELAFQEKMS